MHENVQRAMPAVSKDYRFDQELAHKILEAAQAHVSSSGITTAEMMEMEPFEDHSYEAVVANCLYLWDDACIYLQAIEIGDGPLQGNMNYQVLALTGIGEDRLRTFRRSST